MRTLISHYQDTKEKLKSRLEAADTIEEIVKVTQSEINSLTDFNSEYIKGLTPPQARLAKTMLRSLYENIGMLRAVKLQNSAPSKDIAKKTFSGVDLGQIASNSLSPLKKIAETQKNFNNLTSPDYYKQALLQPLRTNRVVASSLVAAGLAGTLEGGLSWGLLGAIIGGITGGMFGKVVGKQSSSEEAEDFSKSNTPSLPSAIAEPKLEVDINSLLSQLYQAFQSIDLSVAAYANRSKEEKVSLPGLENNLDLLEYLQELMADCLDEDIQLPISVRRRIEQATTILRHHGIEALVYQHTGELHGDRVDDLMFYFEPSIDPEVKEYITLKHALIKDGRVLLPGCVIEPVSNGLS
ncbi:hypothetical protein [Mastigocoleus testarum]|uniref:Uncharacterized protein n=1 Tax=Mastigocoleus testarum BC008 TaxID=371196 RepID=A0A0V7ZNR0_9CYAN|nr:hypothetical protein [Mastigocoleus testarum]KST65878.1 hypothetical protein BC008_23135 [Mastigocoleus testarum BC008]